MENNHNTLKCMLGLHEYEIFKEYEDQDGIEKLIFMLKMQKKDYYI